MAEPELSDTLTSQIDSNRQLEQFRALRAAGHLEEQRTTAGASRVRSMRFLNSSLSCSETLTMKFMGLYLTALIGEDVRVVVHHVRPTQV